MLCPKCHNKLQKVNNSYVCINNHTYDISKNGYVNLLLSKTNSGDNKELVNSRVNFLSKGFYDKLVFYMINIIKRYSLHNLLDCGCGIGYYSQKLSEHANITGIDISKDAIMYASKHDKKSFYFVCSSSDIPIEEKAFDAVYAIFAPVFSKIVESLLVDNGYLIIVSPNINHLYELKEIIYNNPYYNKVKENNDLTNFTLISQESLSYVIHCQKEDILNLVAMTPYMYKTSKKDLDKLNNIDFLNITVDFLISIYKK